MEKMKKEENLVDDLELLREYGFNIDEMLSQINAEENEEENN